MKWHEVGVKINLNYNPVYNLSCASTTQGLHGKPTKLLKASMQKIVRKLQAPG